MVEKGQKIFCSDDKFADVINELEKRGWQRNPNRNSPMFDLKWRNFQRINFRLLRKEQYVNHFQNANHLSEKSLLCQHLYHYKLQNEEVEIDSFFPRSWVGFVKDDLKNLGISNVKKNGEQEDLVITTGEKNHHHQSPGYGLYIEAQSILRNFVVGILKDVEEETSSHNKHYNNEIFLNLCIAVCENYYTSGVNDETLNEFLVLYNVREDILEKTNNNRKPVINERLNGEVKKILKKLSENDGQYELNGLNAAWIIKPHNQSCGDNITCVKGFRNLCKEIKERKFNCVVQKYIENPLLVYGRKFDIRLWVLVTSVNPMIVWVFNDCYLRFSSKKFDLNHIEDRVIHLTNFGVQEERHEEENHIEDSSIPENNWTGSKLRKHLIECYGYDVYYEKIFPSMKSIVVNTLKSVQHILEKKSNGFEWLGFDFMIAEDFNVYLMEVNVSPDVSRETKVRGLLVDPATKDIFNLIFDESAVDLPEEKIKCIDEAFSERSIPMSREDPLSIDNDKCLSTYTWESSLEWKLWHTEKEIDKKELKSITKEMEKMNVQKDLIETDLSALSDCIPY